MPLPPADEGEQPKLEFSVVECLLFAFHHLVKGRHIGFLTAEENTDRLKDFRQRSVEVTKVSRGQTFVYTSEKEDLEVMVLPRNPEY